MERWIGSITRSTSHAANGTCGQPARAAMGDGQSVKGAEKEDLDSPTT
jgi:hypothetical protein